MPSLHPHRQRQPAEALQARASRDIKKRKEKTMCTVSINIDEATMRRINPGLTRHQPSLTRWSNYHMANTDKWYFAYTIDDDTITIVDACHAQNMHEKEPKP